MATLAFDAISRYISSEQKDNSFSEKQHDEIRSLLSVNDLNFYVAPKETDMIMKKASELIAYSVNKCFNKELEYEEMISLVNS